MREILFKAKRIDNGEWVEGFYWTNLVGNHFIKIAQDKTGRLVIEDFEIDPDTLCQFTGLTDKNGNRIWENDIVTISAYSYTEPEDDYTGIISYSEDLASWVLEDINDTTKLLFPVCGCFGSYITEIDYIGNIFDNKDLLEVE